MNSLRGRRERLVRLNAELLKLDEKTMQFDPEPEYRAEIKERLMSAEVYADNVQRLRKRIAQTKRSA